jgi:hypothetical protein
MEVRAKSSLRKLANFSQPSQKLANFYEELADGDGSYLTSVRTSLFS